MPDRIFSQLEPLPGGLAGLRERIERDAHRRVRLRRVQASVAATLLAALVGWAIWGPRTNQSKSSPELDLVRIHLGLLPSPSKAVTIPEDRRNDLAVRRVPLPTDQVVFYRVGSIEEASTTGDSDQP